MEYELDGDITYSLALTMSPTHALKPPSRSPFPKPEKAKIMGRTAYGGLAEVTE
jgi:hypothetical protein